MGSGSKPVLIIGAGVVGLTLAHGLQQAQVPFEVYERDAHVDARAQGWAITLHWALPYVRQLLDAATLAAVDGAQVDPALGGGRDAGHFVFLNLATLEPKFRIPPNERRRVHRERLRRALLRGVAAHVRWGRRLVGVELLGGAGDGGAGAGAGAGVRARFADGSTADGCLLVGADGAQSRTRQFLVPDGHANRPLPVRLVGAAVDMTPAQVAPLRAIDPLLFQGCHPRTGTFLWVSMLETPAAAGHADPAAGRGPTTADTNADTNADTTTTTPPAGDDRFRVQLMMSWPVPDDTDAAATATAPPAAAEMRRRALDLHPTLRAAVLDGLPASTAVAEVALCDWPCPRWDNRGGRVTLVGDAAHAMTMYRGEAANHGILDAFHLVAALRGLDAPADDADADADADAARRRAVDAFEEEMRDRAGPAVLLSRQACLDAHDFDALNEHSAVLKRRAVQLTPAAAAAPAQAAV